MQKLIANLVKRGKLQKPETSSELRTVDEGTRLQTPQINLRAIGEGARQKVSTSRLNLKVWPPPG